MNKVMLITGGASGIGLATAVLAVEKGWMPVIADRDAGALRAAGEALRQKGHPCAVVEIDVSDRQQCIERIDEVRDLHGAMSALVTCAGISLDTRLSEANASDKFDRVIDVNLTGVFNTIAASVTQLKQTRGSIVTLSSIVSFTGGFAGAGYVASKGAMNALTRQFCRELAPDGIRVNAVAPGFIETPMLNGRDLQEWLDFHCPARRLGRPEEVAEAICFLAGSAASFISGAILPVDGGYLTV